MSTTSIYVLAAFALTLMPSLGNGLDPTLRNPKAASVKAENSTRAKDGLATLRPITAGMQRTVKRPSQGEDGLLQLAALTAAAPAMGRQSHATPVADDVVIDVIVAYTQKAARNYADITRELIEPAIESGNLSFRLSGIGHVKLRLVHAYRTDYVETGEHFDHVWRFADKGDGYMDEIHGLRDRYRADVAILVVDDASSCGQATRVRADEDDAFAVVHHECARTNYTVAHEIGHLIGASHERGYVHGHEWRDIMSYKATCSGCPRLPVWSNPRILIHGHPAGTAKLDNAMVIATQATRVASFR